MRPAGSSRRAGYLGPNTVVEGMAFINAGSDGINIFPGANDTVIKEDFLGVNPQKMQAAPTGSLAWRSVR